MFINLIKTFSKRLEEMIQEMARQNLSIENQLVKRNTKRNGVGRGGKYINIRK